MQKIITLGRLPKNQPDSLWQFSEQTISVQPYHCRKLKAKLIRAIINDKPDMLALDKALMIKAPSPLPLTLADGRLLTLALLPELLDQEDSSWRHSNIGINCDNLPGRLAALVLLQETRQLSITGRYAKENAEQLYSRFGVITNQAPIDFPLSQLPLPETIATDKGIIPIYLAEALLAMAAGTKPTLSLRYLRRLRHNAQLYGFTVAH